MLGSVRAICAKHGIWRLCTLSIGKLPDFVSIGADNDFLAMFTVH